MAMRKVQMIAILLLAFVLTGCGMLGSESASKTNEEKKQEAQINVKSYEAYLAVLEDIIENNTWPEGDEVLEDEGFGYIEENRFAIVDVDQDGEDELLVEITTASMAGMDLRVYDYNSLSKEVKCKWSEFPTATFYNNGTILAQASHNHTSGFEIWPYTLYEYNKDSDSYDVVGNAYCDELEFSGDAFDVESDVDQDGIIYYVSDGQVESEAEALTEEEYNDWLDSYVGDATELYIPWYELWSENVEKLSTLIHIDNVILPVALEDGVEISQYDVTGDEKADSILIVCGEPSYEVEGWGGFGSEWCIYVNGEKCHDFEWEEDIMLEVDLYQAGTERAYFAVTECDMNNGDIWGHGLYQIVEGKLTEVCDLFDSVSESINAFHFVTELEYMTEDLLVLDCWNQFNATAGLGWDMEYKYRQGQWKLADTEYEIKYEEYMQEKADGMTANQDFVVYTDINCEEEAYEVYEGNVLKIQSVRIEDGAAYFKVINEEGEEGWLPDPDESYIEIDGSYLEGYFEEAMFAG